MLPNFFDLPVKQCWLWFPGLVSNGSPSKFVVAEVENALSLAWLSGGCSMLICVVWVLYNENYNLLLIIPCKIEKIAMTLEKTKMIFKKFRIVAGSLPYKSRNMCIKISHNCWEIAFCLVGYFNLNHPVCLYVIGANVWEIFNAESRKDNFFINNYKL